MRENEQNFRESADTQQNTHPNNCNFWGLNVTFGDCLIINELRKC